MQSHLALLWPLLALLSGCVRGGFAPAVDRDGAPAVDQASAIDLLDVGCVADLCPADGALGPAAITVSALRVAWTTPNTIRWEWDTSGEPVDLDHFELTITDTVTGSRQVIGPSENPALSAFLRPQTGGPDPVGELISRELLADRTYRGQVIAVDTAGRRSLSSEVVAETIAEPTRAIELYTELTTPGYSLPSELVAQTNAPFSGSEHLQYDVPACGEATCFEHLRRQDLDVDLSGIDATSFATTAFFEVAVRLDASVPTYYAESRLWFGPSSDPDPLAHVVAFTIVGDATYRIYQFPLRAYRHSGQALTHAEIQRGLFEAGVGGFWQAGQTVRVDAMRIRW